jgi:outer membrane immunogenic protein
MRKLLPGSILTMLGLGASAMAGDLEVPEPFPAPPYKAPAPVPSAFTWGGFYIGGNVGGHWGSDKITTAADSDLPATVDTASPVTLNPRGFEGGAQAGYNIAGIGGVWGVEVDVNARGGTASRTLTGIPALPAVDALSNSAQAGFLSTFRLRWGVPYDRLLFYITGGFAVGTLKTTDTFAQVGFPTQSVSASITRAGVAAGAGIDFAITPDWWARAEYLFIDMQDFTTTIPASVPGALDSIMVTHQYTDNILRFAINYRLSTVQP